MGNDTFYFVVFSTDERDTLTVIDLARCVDYEREDWRCVDGENFTERDKAIAHASALASSNGIKYEPFESRYDSRLNEPKLVIK